MAKQFIYKVTNMEFIENKPFGRAWEAAVAWAEHYHTGITRTVVDGKKKRHEFLAKGGIFLNEKFYDEKKVKIF